MNAGQSGIHNRRFRVSKINLSDTELRDVLAIHSSGLLGIDYDDFPFRHSVCYGICSSEGRECLGNEVIRLLGELWLEMSRDGT